MTSLTKKLLPVAILADCFLIAMLIRMNPPDTTQRTPFAGPQMVVEIATVR